jgi:hypothetical protein
MRENYEKNYFGVLDLPVEPIFELDDLFIGSGPGRFW